MWDAVVRGTHGEDNVGTKDAWPRCVWWVSEGSYNVHLTDHRVLEIGDVHVICKRLIRLKERMVR